MRHPQRKAFGLMELLIVIAFIALVVATLLPVVQRLREAAARTQSINNLKTILLAFQGFNDATRHLPFNGSDTAVKKVRYSAVAKKGDARSGSWAFQILPFTCSPITCRLLQMSRIITIKGGANKPFSTADQNSILMALTPT